MVSFDLFFPIVLKMETKGEKSCVKNWLKQIHVYYCKSSVINDLHLECFLFSCTKHIWKHFPYAFFFSNSILHTLIPSHYVSLQFAMQVQIHLISPTTKNTMEFMKNTRRISCILPRKHLETFLSLGNNASGEDHVLKSPIFRSFLWNRTSSGVVSLFMHVDRNTVRIHLFLAISLKLLHQLR